MARTTTTRRQVVKGVAGMALAWQLPAVVGAQSATPAATPAASPAATPGATPMAAAVGTRPFLIALDPAHLEIVPLLTSGETIGDYQMAGVPDGLGATKVGDDLILFMNHELTPEEHENLSYARVSRLALDSATGMVKSGAYVLDGTEGYERLCSASLAGPEVGFTKPVFLTGEESTSGKKGGLSLAIDAASGKVTELPWLGHLAHENQVVVPGFSGKTVVITTDDDSRGSELYMYVADSPEGMLAGDGQLHVFTAGKAANTGDIAKGAELTGSFVAIDQKDNTDAKALQAAADKAGAFRFVRLEDVTYDRKATTTIYFADTGDDHAPNLDASGKPFTKNGRIYTMTLDAADPTKVTGFKVLLDGDNGDDLRNPDNLDADEQTLLIQEDLNGYNRQESSDATGRILAYDLAGGTLAPIAKIDQSDGDGLVDAGDKAGSWESSGILNVAALFGPGAWLTVVQAHTLQVDQFGNKDEGGQLLMLRQR